MFEDIHKDPLPAMVIHSAHNTLRIQKENNSEENWIKKARQFYTTISVKTYPSTY